ncbi:MAG: hypothetical protein K0R29_2214 [Pseudobdellovibrio sp.]|jgi:hypothetical protein|nr:hypothetical protein [Pseudobdellovibrio sp.]
MLLSTFKCNLKYAALILSGLILTLVLFNFIDNKYLQTAEIIDDQDVLLKKINYFKEHKDEYTAVFVGASRTYRQFDAVYFDNLVRQTDQNIRTFNFGAPGLGWTEVFYILNFINQIKPANLKYVFFEPIPFSKIYPENLATAENLRVHDFQFTYLAIKNILASDEHPIYLFHQTYFHVLSLLRRVTCTGCTVNYFAHRMAGGPAHAQNFKDDYNRNAGFVALDDDSKIKLKKHLDFLETAETTLPALAAAQVQRIKEIESSPDKSNPADRQILTLAEEAKEAAPNAIMVAAPQLRNHDRMEGRTEYMERLSKVKVWSFLDPREYPEFSRAENRWEEQHLNKRGAILYTEKLAEKFKQSFKAENR